LRVLIVDDAPDMAESLAMLVRLWGHQPAVARDGPQALRAARATRPDVVLLDLSIPGLDGFEVARQLRADPELAGGRLVALTGYGEEPYRRLAQDVGFDLFLVKPVEPEVLERALQAGRGRPE
jgi:CheY-like chemotaxis protein